MARGRSLNIWHVPKRGSIHQLVGAVNIIDKLQIKGKKWPNSRKFFDQKFAIWGLTSRGRSLSRNASETFEALMKYLGLVVISDGKIFLTDAGKKLVKEYDYKKPSIEKRHLNETIEVVGAISSDIIMTQMLKLCLTNPTIKQYCSGILLFPFRETLYFLLDNEINHLEQEEIALFLFHMSSSSERSLIKKKILEFRALSEKQRKNIVDRYLKTADGNLTLGQAPTATYWRQLCENTGLCDSDGQKLKIKDAKKLDAMKILSSYSDYVYDFKSNERLWNEYFGDPDILDPPVDIKITIEGNADGKFLSIVRDKQTSLHMLNNENTLTISVFTNQKYDFEIFDIEGEKIIKKITHQFNRQDNAFLIKLDGKLSVPKPDFTKSIIELLNADFDSYYKKLIHVISEKTNEDLENKKNHAWLRGGRLEYLFFKNLEILEKQGKISNLVWNGKVDSRGIAHSAPGTRKGLSDIIFQCGSTHYLLELTTIKSATQQWQAEGMSVPFHIRNFIKEKSISNVLGILCPPIIHEKVRDSLKSSRLPAHYDIAYLSIHDFLGVLNKSNLEMELKKLK